MECSYLRYGWHIECARPCISNEIKTEYFMYEVTNDLAPSRFAFSLFLILAFIQTAQKLRSTPCMYSPTKSSSSSILMRGIKVCDEMNWWDSTFTNFLWIKKLWLYVAASSVTSHICIVIANTLITIFVIIIFFYILFATCFVKMSKVISLSWYIVLVN